MTIKSYLLPVLVLTISVMAMLSSCRGKKKPNPALVKQSDWRYFGEANPGSNAQLFLPEIISTRHNERDFTTTAAGNEIFYSMVMPGNSLSALVYLYHDGAFWSDKIIPSFSGRYSDLEPSFTPDGNQLFFASRRPMGKTNHESNWNIWYVDRKSGGWSEAIALDSLINTSGNEFYPSISSNGNLYFTAQRDDSFGGEDIFVSRKISNTYTKPENLGPVINSQHAEFNAFIAPDESYLIFSSFGRDDDLGGGDLYIAYRANDTTWSAPKNMGKGINSTALDYCPFVTTDGHYLFFTSERSDRALTDRNPKSMTTLTALDDGIENGLGNIYWVEFKQ